MPTVNLNRKVFEKLVGKKLALNELKDRWYLPTVRIDQCLTALRKYPGQVIY